MAGCLRFGAIVLAEVVSATELLEQEARLKEGDAAIDSIAVADEISSWIDTVLDDAAPLDPSELGCLAADSLKKARKLKDFLSTVLFAALVDFYRWMPRMGRLRASLRVSKNHGRGPAFQRVLCTQARFFEANGALKPTHQGHRAKQYGLLDDEGFYMGVQRWLRTLEVGKVNPKLLQKHDGRERKDVKKRRKEYLAELEALDPFRAKYAEPDMAEILLEAFVAQAFQPTGGLSVARRDEAMRRLMCGYSPHPHWTWDVAFSAHTPVRPTDLVASHFCRAFLEAEKVSVWERRLGTQSGLHSEYGPYIDGNGILSFTTNVCATMAVRYIGKTWFRFADAANAQQAVGMLAEEVWGEVSNDTAVASVAEIEEVEAEVQRTLEIARFLAGPVIQAVWPTMLLDPFFHLPNLRDGWDHLGSAHSLEVMSLTSMMQRSLLPNVLNNRARDMMLQLLARLYPTEELEAVLEFIEHNIAVDVSEDINNLDKVLPRYENNDGEIHNNSCTVIAYTVSQWKDQKFSEEKIGFNIKWAVVLGKPVD
ncbi:hypothetical protein B0H13DRAFT_2305164 [Mycena leptocephala]|nr:hypothetical protein B0H13DRAFT_2305164 [Mycena leptocephala]